MARAVRQKRVSVFFMAFSTVFIAVMSGCARNQPVAHTPAVPQRSAPASALSLDVNDDGVVDTKDVLLLMAQANDLVDKKIKPLLAKAGVDWAGEIPTDVRERVKNRLTPADQQELEAAISSFQQLQGKVKAAMALALAPKR